MDSNGVRFKFEKLSLLFAGQRGDKSKRSSNVSQRLDGRDRITRLTLSPSSFSSSSILIRVFFFLFRSGIQIILLRSRYFNPPAWGMEARVTDTDLPVRSIKEQGVSGILR